MQEVGVNTGQLFVDPWRERTQPDVLYKGVGENAGWHRAARVSSAITSEDELTVYLEPIECPSDDEVFANRNPISFSPFQSQVRYASE